jgi:hypothetical protein
LVDLTHLGKRLDEFNELFKRIDDDDEDFDEELTSVPRMSPSAYHEFLARRAMTPYGRALSELHGFLVPTVLDAYVHGSEDERQAILDALAQRRFARISVWSLLSEYRWRLQKSPPETRPAVLRTLLLLAVLAEKFLDEPDTATILRSAWREAEFSGLDAAQFFREAAEVAGRREVIYGRSASQILREFVP